MSAWIPDTTTSRHDRARMVKRFSTDEIADCHKDGDYYVLAADHDATVAALDGELNQAADEHADKSKRIRALEAELAEARKLLERVLRDGRAYLALASPPE